MQRTDHVHRLSASAARGRGRVEALTGLLCMLGLTLVVALAAPLPALPSPWQLPWWALAPMFFVAEACVVHVQFRREAHSFSLSELPLVVGLFFATPLQLVIGNLVGAAAALVVHRRQSPLKVLFNLANFTIGACVAVTLFIRLVDALHPLATLGLGIALGSVLIAAVLQVVVILGAISLSEGGLESMGILSTFGFALIGSAINACVALMGVWVIWRDPTVGWLLAVPTIGVWAAYRLYVSERERRRHIDFLYDASRQLQRTDALEEALTSLLNHARSMLRAETAEITFFPAGDEQPFLRTSLDAAGGTVSMSPEALGSGERSFIRQLLVSESLIVRDSGRRAQQVAFLEERGFRDAMAVVVPAEGGPLGMMVFGNRLGAVSSFDDEDLRLLEGLANQTGSILEKGRLQHSLTQLSALQDQLRHQASHDPLTGIANRTLFQARVDQALAHPNRLLAVLLIDVDDFKTVNDSLGHAAGDRLLCAIAERIDRCLRPGDVVARLGGDEFAVLVGSVDDAGEATRVAERIIGILGEPFVIANEDVLVHASIGVVVARSAPTRSSEELMLDADLAMYGAKSLGKDRWELFSERMYEAVRARHRLKAELHRALAHREFELVYQPIVDLHTADVVAAEALLRWRRPSGEVSLPAAFLDLAEETGLIVPIGTWVIETACEEAMRWRSRSGRAVAVSVNVSARQLMQSTFATTVARALDRAGLCADRLILEITETHIIDDPEPIIRSLAELRRMGVRIAIDDFGTGQSSLSRLRDFPLDVLKVDKSFTAALCDPEMSISFAQAVFSFGASLNLQVLAEGVEVAAQLPWLRELRCDWAQGSYFSNPLSAPAIEALLGNAEKIRRLAANGHDASHDDHPVHTVGTRVSATLGYVPAPLQASDSDADEISRTSSQHQPRSRRPRLW